MRIRGLDGLNQLRFPVTTIDTDVIGAVRIPLRIPAYVYEEIAWKFEQQDVLGQMLDWIISVKRVKHYSAVNLRRKR